MVLQATGIFKSYGSLPILTGVDLSVTRGQIVSIIGKSGSGKSTLLHILGTLDQADSGQVIINDTDVIQLAGRQRSSASSRSKSAQAVTSQRALAAFRNQHIGFVFQFHHLLPEFTALENVCVPGYIAGHSRAEVERRATELLDYLGLSHRLTHKPTELSGGEQQRVAVARALVNRPDIIFADEPTGNLDSAASNDFLQLMRRLRDEHQQTFVIVTHNQELADLSDRCLLMQDGQLIERPQST
jgi:lipoprotein-releasing system ATP-binding protein